jgi:hypothetical protein
MWLAWELHLGASCASRQRHGQRPASASSNSEPEKPFTSSLCACPRVPCYSLLLQQYSSSARKTTTTTRVTSLFEVSVEGSVAPPSASTPYSILFKTRADQICTYMLAVITFGLLGFASMSNSMHNHDGKSQGKCACGTYPLYLTEAEAGGSMLNRMLKGPHKRYYKDTQVHPAPTAAVLQGHSASRPLCLKATASRPHCECCAGSRDQTRYYFLDTTIYATGLLMRSRSQGAQRVTVSLEHSTDIQVPCLLGHQLLHAR